MRAAEKNVGRTDARAHYRAVRACSYVGPNESMHVGCENGRDSVAIAPMTAAVAGVEHAAGIHGRRHTP